MRPLSKSHTHRPVYSPWSPVIILRYSLLQLPAALLVALVVLLVDQRLMPLPPWFVWGLVGAWVLKDAVMYPFFWRAYAPALRDQRLAMIGRSGKVIEPLDPVGYVRVHGELWKATTSEGQPPIEKGQTISVTGIRGLLLTVTPSSLSHPTG